MLGLFLPIKCTIIPILLFLPMITKSEGKMIYDFNVDSSFRNWEIVDDGVMGGRSSGLLKKNKDGHGQFSGYISLENYGGFSSVRLRTKSISVNDYDYIVIKVLGDNKFYQLRIKSSPYDRHVYVKKFYAKNEWQEIAIPLNSMQPQFRGRRLRMRNFRGDSIIEVGMLVGNKVEENFSIIIDSIKLR